MWLFNPLTAKLFNLNFHPLEVVSRCRDPQLQVSENYSDLTKWGPTIFKSCWLMSDFIFTIFKMWYLMYLIIKIKTQMYAAPAVKGLASSAQKLYFFFITIFHPFGRICCALVAINDFYIFIWRAISLGVHNAQSSPVMTKHLYDICIISAQRLRRWPNIV